MRLLHLCVVLLVVAAGPAAGPVGASAGAAHVPVADGGSPQIAPDTPRVVPAGTEAHRGSPAPAPSATRSAHGDAAVPFAAGSTRGASAVPSAPRPVHGDHAAEPPPDPPEDRLGWENGYWYNESVTVNRNDGLNESELDAVVSRAMARVEVIRELEFERTPPVEVISRSTFRENTRRQYRRANISTADRLHQNVKWEAMFMVGEGTDAIAVQRENTASGTLGFYVTSNASGLPEVSRGDIVLISENETAPKVDEITLAQELFHAVQDQRLKTNVEYNLSTEEANNAVLGVIEGDGNYVDFLYEQRCNDEWDCLLPPDDGGGGGAGGAGDVNVGLLLVSLSPYSEGPPFVKRVRDRGGWEAVNALYDDPPASTEQLIHPKKYPDETPRDLKVTNTSSEGWRVLDLNGTVDYATFGEAGLFVMLYYPSYQQRSDVVVPFDIFGEQPPGLYDYAHPYSTGWDGDRLVPYVNATSAATNETGYVWKTGWDDAENASEFATGYRELLESRGAERVGPDTYVIPTSEERGYGGEFGDAIHLIVEDDTVTIVNAPRVEDLPKIRASATADTSATATPTSTPAGTDVGTDTATPGGDGDDRNGGTTATTSTPTGTTDAPVPGFGPVATAVALGLVAALLVLGRRRRR